MKKNIIFDIEFELVPVHPLYNDVKSTLSGQKDMYFEPRYTSGNEKLNIISIDIIHRHFNKYKLQPRYLYSKLGHFKLITIDLVYM